MQEVLSGLPDEQLAQTANKSGNQTLSDLTIQRFRRRVVSEPEELAASDPGQPSRAGDQQEPERAPRPPARGLSNGERTTSRDR